VFFGISAGINIQNPVFPIVLCQVPLRSGCQKRSAKMCVSLHANDVLFQTIKRKRERKGERGGKREREIERERER
jgi:hypothetical protein